MKPAVAIIGGGIAGMEAARQLLLLGYTPIMIEKSDHLGGHVGEWHCLFPDMSPAADLVENLKNGIKGATVFLETGIAFINRIRDTYNVMLDNGISIPCQAVLFATGYELFDAAKKEEYGYGIYNHVVTNRDLELWFGGREDARFPAKPSTIGFVHCVGSRDIKAGNMQCSKVCCMTAIKQAIEMKEKFPKAEIYCFYMDLRLFGKKYEDFYIKAQRDHGIHFIRGRVSEVGENYDGTLQIKAEDTLNGKPLKLNLDLLVLMAGMVCGKDNAKLTAGLRMGLDTDGFLRSRDNIYGVTDSNRRGVFFAGACTGTKTIPETISEARAAVLGIHNYLMK
ncbi:MAG: CoB--CoM heterodisulfide reductase iron-sulfur subunit A family protein [Bacteroidales bacterium]|nr:CoB--CoM heterodisulfide reductase iron-sulfur subunit A family protein [Bacteroidales bacterium]